MGERRISNHAQKALTILVGGAMVCCGCRHSKPYAQQNENEGGASIPTGVSGAITGASSESALSRRVRQIFKDNPALSSVASKIRVSEENGEVTLTGTVPHEQERELFGSLVKTVPGVVAVSNQLKVSELSASAINSSAPFAHIYSNAPAITGNEVLSPTSERQDAPARIYSQSQTASDSARESSQAGQTLKVNVQSTGHADEQLAQQLSEALKADTSLVSIVRPLTLLVDNGKVTLRGAVRNEQTKRDIEAAVQRVTGITDVIDELHVSNNQIDTDPVH